MVLNCSTAVGYKKQKEEMEKGEITVDLRQNPKYFEQREGRSQLFENHIEVEFLKADFEVDFQEIKLYFQVHN